jgi:hypothetical protein
MSFKSEQIELLDSSGWNTCTSINEALKSAGLPAPSAKYLGKAFSDRQWAQAAGAVQALREKFKDARFAKDVVYGVLLVPDPGKLDTRGALPSSIRRDQLGDAVDDVVDERLPAGRLVVQPGRDWTMVATVVGSEGVSMGSYDAIAEASVDLFTVEVWIPGSSWFVRSGVSACCKAAMCCLIARSETAWATVS